MDVMHTILAALFGIAFWELIKFANYEVGTRKERKKAKAYWEQQVREAVGPGDADKVTVGFPDNDEEEWRPGEYRVTTHYTDKAGRPVRAVHEVRRTDDYIPGEE